MEKNKLSIIGIGKLGLSFALILEKNGYDVLGVDIVNDYVDKINKKEIKSDEPEIENHIKNAKNFVATTDIERGIQFSDYLFLVVATPSLHDGRYDHSQVENISKDLIRYHSSGQKKNLIVCCTTMPGYCDSLKLRLEPYGYSISYNPEFIAQGSVMKDLTNPDIILIGQENKTIGDKIEKICLSVVNNSPTVHRMSIKEAEITKIALNCFLTTKIAYANMIGDISIASNCNPEKILNAIGSDERIGNRNLKYGYGFGGPCFPRDNRALAVFADDNNIDAVISKASDLANKLHLKFQLEDFIKKNDKSKPIVFSDLAYKSGTTIIEESQKLNLAIKLAQKGYKVLLQDRKEVLNQINSIYKDLFKYQFDGEYDEL